MNGYYLMQMCFLSEIQPHAGVKETKKDYESGVKVLKHWAICAAEKIGCDYSHIPTVIINYSIDKFTDDYFTIKFSLSTNDLKTKQMYQIHSKEEYNEVLNKINLLCEHIQKIIDVEIKKLKIEEEFERISKEHKQFLKEMVYIDNFFRL